jgi:mono/diheme cytochrome c family protein
MASTTNAGAGPPSVRRPGLCGLLVLLGLGTNCLAELTATQAQAGRSAAEPARRSDRPPAERLQAARRVFERHCSSCHGDDGTGSALRQTVSQIPDFTSRGWQTRRTDAQLVGSILEGKGARMPAFHRKLGEDSAQDLVSLIRTFDRTYDPAATRRQAVSPEEFERRLRQLDAELEDLKKQYRDAASPPRRP